MAVSSDTHPTESLFDHAGGNQGLHDLIDVFYASVLRDPVLIPLFGSGRPTHVEHLTAWFAEVLGGPARYTDELGGFPTLLAAHRNLKIAEEQRARFVELFMAATDGAGLGRDARFRERLRAYVEFGTEVALQNSHATSEAELHPCQEVPRWAW